MSYYNSEIRERGMKTCNTCDVEKPLTEFYTHKLKNGELGYAHECKECLKTRIRTNYEKNKTNTEFKQKRNEHAKKI